MSDETASIAFFRERSATDVINVTFDFLQEQFVPLAKGLLLLAGPFFLVANMVAPFSSGVQAAEAGGMRPGLVTIQILGSVIGAVVASAVVIGAIQVYRVEGASALTTTRLWEMVRTHGIPLLGRQIQVGIVVGLGAMLGVGIIAAIAAGFGVFRSDSVALGILLVLVGVVFVFGWVLYAGPTFMLLFPGQVDDERPISMSRCMDLVKGRWGQTLGVWVLAAIITFFLSSVGRIPVTVLNVLQAMGGSATGEGGLLVAGGIAGVTNALAPAVTYTAITLQYFNLIEQKEQVSLEEDVSRLGTREHSAVEGASEDDRPDQAASSGGPSASAGSGSEEPPHDPSDLGGDDETRWQDGGAGGSSREE